MGLIGRTFVVASLSMGMLITGFVVTSRGAQHQRVEAPMTFALAKPMPPTVGTIRSASNGDGGTTLLPPRREALLQAGPK